MRNLNEDRKRCANEGCERIAEEGSVLCAECSLEWALFHRELRATGDGNSPFPAPQSGCQSLRPGSSL